MIVLLLSVLLQSHAATAKPAWVGDLTLTMKGSGTIEERLAMGGSMKVTWNVARIATGRVVLDRSFKGGGIAGTPNTRDTLRYETWIADSRQPLTMQVRDTGTYFGPVGGGRNIALDDVRYTCPAKDTPGAVGQIRSSILQLDFEKGTYAFESPRLFMRCETSYLRMPKQGPPAWLARTPFELVPGPIDVEFEMIAKLNPLQEWRTMTGSFVKGATEIVLSRTFDFQWMHPIAGRAAPVRADLQLVLRKAG